MKETFEVEKDGEKIKIDVCTPNGQVTQDAKLHYMVVFGKAIANKIPIRSKLDDYLIEQGIWSEEKEKQLNAMSLEINEKLRMLDAGNIKLSAARKLALEVKGLRQDIRELVARKTELDANTAEGMAENEKFAYLVAACTVYNSNGERYFKNLDDYYARSDDSVAMIASYKLMTMLYSGISEYEKNLPENDFLRKYKFIDDKLRLINKDGHYIDEEGRLIDEQGRFVNEQNEPVDIAGNRVNVDGVAVASEKKPFLDDDGNALTE